MPLKLIPPRAGKSPNWTIRGTLHGVSVDRTSGASDKASARKKMRAIENEIERGAFAVKGEPTFADAAKAYVVATGQKRYVMPVAEHFAYTPLKSIDAAAVDEAAAALYPNVSPATRNRQVHTPVSAILRHAGVVIVLNRPKGSAGVRRLAYLEPPQAFALLDAAWADSVRFGALLTFLLYTGARIGEALDLRCKDVNLSESRALILQTKTEAARTAFLPPPIIAALTALPAGLERSDERVFGWRPSGKLYDRLEAVAKAAGVPIPDGVAFHIFRHTWGTWMRRYAGLDTAGLVETGTWKSRKSASIYEHLDATAEGRKAAMLPTKTVARAV